MMDRPDERTIDDSKLTGCRSKVERGLKLSRSPVISVRGKHVLLIAALLALSFSTFQYFPGFSPIQEAWWVLCFLYLVFVYPFQKCNDCLRGSAFEWYVLALALIFPALSAVCALREFGQPILFGLLSERNTTVLFAVLFWMRALQKKIFTLQEIETALLVNAWCMVVVSVFLKTMLNPSSYTSYTGFATGMGGNEIFIIQTHFIVFGAFYYAFRAFRTGRSRDYLPAILLFASGGGRQMLLWTPVTFFFFVIRWSSRKRLLTLIPKLVLGFGLLIGLLYLAMPAAVTEGLGGFQDAFTVVLTGQEVQDVSATARIGETLFAIEGIQKHPILGNGVLSHQWSGGSLTVLGTYFYPDDVGLIGLVYQVGVFGFIMFGWQYWFAIKAVKGLSPESYNPMIDATKAFILYSALLSLGDGGFMFEAAVSLFFIALLRSLADDVRSTESPRIFETVRRRRSWFFLPARVASIQD